MIDDQPKGKKVVLVDDDRFLVDMYSMKFTQMGYMVHGCLSVKEALDVLRAGFQAEAILFDLIMPERDGFSFLEALGKEHLGEKAVKIALTNQSQDADKKRAVELGADTFIVKSMMIPSEVVNMVGEAISQHKSA
jgi:two-component system alkaline phosphatase synthesis response regulator PhoP